MAMLKMTKELRAAFSRELLKAGFVSKIKKISLISVNSYCVGLLAGGTWREGLKNGQRLVIAMPPNKDCHAITAAMSAAKDVLVGDWVLVAYVVTEIGNFNFGIKNRGI